MIRSAFSGVNYACMKLGDAAAASLTAAQRADADSLKLAKRRAEREAVYSLINGCIAPGRLLSHAPDGAPAIDGVGSFSLSHSPRHAAIAWVDAPEAGGESKDMRPSSSTTTLRLSLLTIVSPTNFTSSLSLLRM